MRESIHVAGQWHIRVIDEEGHVVDERHASNLITNSGLDYLRNYCLFGGSPTSQDDPMDYIAIGSDSTTATVSDTALGTELARQQFSTIVEGGTGVVSVDTTFAAGVGTGTIAEAGILNASSSGDLFNRVVFDAVTKGASDVLKVSCTVTFS